MTEGGVGGGGGGGGGGSLDRGARSLLVFGIYRAILGGCLIVAPRLVLHLAGGAPGAGGGGGGGGAGSEVWLRLVGLLLWVLAFYDVEAARLDLTPFMHVTVLTRYFLLVALAVLVVLHIARPGLLVFGAVELLGAVWTRRALGGGEAYF